MSGGSNLKIVDRGVEYRSRSPTCTERIIRLIKLQRPVRAAGRARCEVIHHIRTKRAIYRRTFARHSKTRNTHSGDYAVSYTFLPSSDPPSFCLFPPRSYSQGCIRPPFCLRFHLLAYSSRCTRLVARHATRRLPRTRMASDAFLSHRSIS